MSKMADKSASQQLQDVKLEDLMLTECGKFTSTRDWSPLARGHIVALAKHAWCWDPLAWPYPGAAFICQPLQGSFMFMVWTASDLYSKGCNSLASLDDYFATRSSIADLAELNSFRLVIAGPTDIVYVPFGHIAVVVSYNFKGKEAE